MQCWEEWLLTCKLLRTTGNELLISNQTVCLNGRGSGFHSGAGQGPLHSPSSLLRYTHALLQSKQKPLPSPPRDSNGQTIPVISNVSALFWLAKLLLLIDFVVIHYFKGMSYKFGWGHANNSICLSFYQKHSVFFKTFQECQESSDDCIICFK